MQQSRLTGKGTLFTFLMCYIDREEWVMKKTLVIKKSHEDSGDSAYWVTKSPQQRLAALEEIRKEYIQWKFGAQSRPQRVYRVIKSS